MGLNVKNVMDLTRSNTIETWYGIAKKISRPTPFDSKLPKKNLTCIASNVLIAKAITSR